MIIKIKKLSINAITPTRGSTYAAGYDLYSTEDYTLISGERHLFKTDIAMVIPAGFYGRLAPRSGLAYKDGLDILAGVLDADFRGNIGVIVINLNHQRSLHDSSMIDVPVKITRGQKIAQIIIEKCHDVAFEEVDNLDDTSRGQDGWGSTGA